VLIGSDLAGVVGSGFGSGFAGEQRSGVRHVDGLALPARNA
jgi:hypothetical protein